MIGLSDAAANLALDVWTARLSGGTLCLYDGSRTIPGAKRLLAEIPFAEPAFLPAQYGRARVRTVGRGDPATLGGTPSWFVARDPDGGPVITGDIGTDLQLDQPTIAPGVSVYLTDWELMLPVEH